MIRVPGLKKFFLLAALLFTGIALTACMGRPTRTADVPRHLPASCKITVAPFTQPVIPAQLITGQIPEDQGRIPADEFAALDRSLREVLLTQTNRQYTFVPNRDLPKNWNTLTGGSRPSALQRWLEYGKRHKAQYLLVPQVLDWHEREGSQAGVTSSAHVRVEFFLLDIEESRYADRSIYEEKQVGLVDDLLKVAEFVKRKAKWVTANELAVEGMSKAVKDLGL